MTAPRRSLLLLVIGLAIGPTPACILVGGTSTSSDPVPPASKANEFAIYPKRPGEVVPTNSAAVASASNTQRPQGDQPLPGPSVSAQVNLPTSTSRTGNRSDSPQNIEPPQLPPTITAARAEHPATQILDVPPPPAGVPGSFGVVMHPHDLPEPPLLAGFRAYLENRPDDAIRSLQPLDRANQEFALAVMPLLLRGTQVNFAAADPNEIAVMVDQFRSVASQLEGKAALRVDKVAFYREKVAGFGQYEPWPEGEPYKPGDLAKLYVEIRNLGSEPAAGPRGQGFVTRAVISLEVRDASGKLVDQIDPTDYRRRVTVARCEETDFTHSPLHDYYRTYRIVLPAQPGVYKVTVEVKDSAGKRTARSQPVQFMVSGP